MIRSVVILAAAVIAQPVGAAEAVFDCKVDSPQATNLLDGSFVTRPITLHGVDDDAWSFTMSKNSRRLSIDWPGSPIGVSGSAEFLETGEETYAAFFSANRSCVFNDEVCGASLLYATQADGSLIIQFSPLAAQQFADGHLEPFVAFLKGRCTPKTEIK